jgi:hypothetical protein
MTYKHPQTQLDQHQSKYWEINLKVHKEKLNFDLRERKSTKHDSTYLIAQKGNN